MLQLEEEGDCSYDFVEVYDGDNDSVFRFGRFCGNRVSRFFRMQYYIINGLRL